MSVDASPFVEDLSSLPAEEAARPVVLPAAARTAEPAPLQRLDVEPRPSLLVRVATGVVNLALDGTILTVGAAVGSQVGLRMTARRRPGPLPHQMANLLDNPLRLAYRKPDDLLGMVGFVAGMSVLDLGCGTGLYTEEMARVVGATGFVHAVDVQPAMLARTDARLEAAGLRDRCLLHHAGAYTLPLEDQTIDIALVVATLGEIPDRLHALLELYRVVKSGGRIAISEELPHPGYLTAGGVRRLAEDAGFVLAARTGTPFCYTSVFTRP